MNCLSSRGYSLLLAGFLGSLSWPSVVQALEIGKTHELSGKYLPGSQFMRVQLLGALELSSEKVNGFAAREISGLAWDEDEQMLYAVSDNGHVFHIRPAFAEGRLTGADLVAAYPLRNAGGKPVSASFPETTDTEGLAIQNESNGIHDDSELIVSLEQNPGVMGFKPDGAYLRDYPLPSPLKTISNYEDPDNALDAVARHPVLGLIVGPARPLKSGDPRFFTMYSLEGKHWRYPPLDPEHSALVGMEAAPDGGLILLERKYQNIFLPVVFAVRKVHPSNAPNPEIPLPVEEIAHFSTADDWSLDNFESIARHQGNRYFLVSDDNTSAIQKTLLVYLEILERPGKAVSE